MSRQEQFPSDFAEWIVRSLDGTITAEQFARLDREITAGSAARAYYLQFITTYVGLVDLVGVLPKPAEFVGRTAPDIDASSELIGIAPDTKDRPRSHSHKSKDSSALRLRSGSSEADRIRQIEQYAREQLEAFLGEQGGENFDQRSRRPGWDLLWVVDKATETAEWLIGTGLRIAKTAAVCTLLAVVILVAAMYVYANRPVATLVDSSDAKWNVNLENQADLPPRLFRLEQGYARIILKKGAEVLLQAPTVFKLETSNKMFLESGWITAKTPAAAVGFTVNTPASTVVDYGTEFGLMVGTQSSAEVHVFDGKIGLGSADSRASTNHLEKLLKGQAATIDSAGSVNLTSVNDRPRLFARTMPTSGGFAVPGKRLSLADMVGGGNGFHTGALGQGINPSTGQITPNRQKVIGGRDNGFVSVPSLLFIDGVFIPDSNDGPAVVSSTGLVFDQCPKTLGKCYETINYGAMFRAGSLELHLGRLAGRTYGTKVSPSLGMHPNAGITFDLGKIRSSLPGVEISRFRALCGLSETAAEYAQRDSDPNAIEVDFWVLVDGKTRFSAKLGAVPPQSQQIDVPLAPNDRFLTLVTTSPGNFLYCWAMFAEPLLELSANRAIIPGRNMR